VHGTCAVVGDNKLLGLLAVNNRWGEEGGTRRKRGMGADFILEYMKFYMKTGTLPHVVSYCRFSSKHSCLKTVLSSSYDRM